MNSIVRQTIVLILTCIFCFHDVYSQENNNNNYFDTICIYKGTWNHVPGFPYYPDDYIYLTIIHQDNVLYQKKTNGQNRTLVFFSVDFVVDSLNIMIFKQNSLSVFGLIQIEDANEKTIYYWNPPDSEKYDSSNFNYSCLCDLHDYLDFFAKNVKLNSNIHGYTRYTIGYEGSYILPLYITPNNIDCFRRLFDK